MSKSKRRIVLTLTSIPPRFSNLPRKFREIYTQSVLPDRIELNIPDHYRRFPGEVPSLPELPEWVEVRRCRTDYGPATKVLPAVERWRGSETDLLVTDDDRAQDRQWVERLCTSRSERPHDIISERGWEISQRFLIERQQPDLPRVRWSKAKGRTAGYRLKRLLSLGQYHPPRRLVAEPGYVDVFEGFLGALVPASAIPEMAFDIPDVVWMVDDVWLSGQAHAAGTRVWTHGTPRPVYSDGRVDKIAALRDYSSEGHGRESADRHAVELLRSKYGAWP